VQGTTFSSDVSKYIADKLTLRDSVFSL